jgi:ribulose-bisphosphate carboxylase large chain
MDIEVPAVNVGENLPTLVAAIADNITELGEVTGLRLVDVTIPGTYRQRFPAPKFGIQGTRKLTGVADRPLFGTIIKPSVGLSPAQTADLVRQLGMAGLDFIKDDELMADPPHSPLRDRVTQVMRAVHAVAEKTGRPLMYAFNISADADTMRAHHDYVVRAGGNCVMVSLNSVGLAATQALCRAATVPVHGHRNGWGMLTRHPAIGMDFTAYQKIWAADRYRSSARGRHRKQILGGRRIGNVWHSRVPDAHRGRRRGAPGAVIRTVGRAAA